MDQKSSVYECRCWRTHRLLDLPGSGTVKRCCSGCRPPGCLCSGRRCPPVSLWRCFSGAVPCHGVAARSSRRPPRTGHSQRRCFQTGTRGRHWQTAPWWPTGIHSAGSCWTFLLPCTYKRSALAPWHKILQHIFKQCPSSGEKKKESSVTLTEVKGHTFKILHYA